MNSGKYSKIIVNTFIQTKAISQLANPYHTEYKNAVWNHLENVGLRRKKVSKRLLRKNRFKVYLSFYLKKNIYDLDNLIDCFINILVPYLGDDDINIYEIKAKKMLKYPIGVKVKIIKEWEGDAL